ncbi:MAG: hypothetical protein ACRDRR_22085 [Pseudonocardiaceae bacterium]
MAVAQLWTTAAAAPEAPLAQPDPGDPVTVAPPLAWKVPRGRITPVERARVPRPVRHRWPGRGTPPTGGDTHHPERANPTAQR